MEMENPRAERVKKVKALANRSVRQRRGQFLAEGPGAVRAAVQYAPDRVAEMYVSSQVAMRHPDIIDSVHAQGLRAVTVTPEVAQAMSGDAQGILAVVNEFHGSLGDVPARVRHVVVLIDVRDPGNVGTIIRTADAVGADAVVLAGTCADPFNPKVVRSSAGSIFQLPLIREKAWEGALASLRSRGLRVVAAHGSAEAAIGDAHGPGSRESLRLPTAWVFGNEAEGLTDAQVHACDDAVRIPIVGRAESLNVASAAAIFSYVSLLSQ